MRWLRAFLFIVFFGSGASALLYQALWQRLLSLHAGMDLFSVTVVVAAFMAGLGLGNLAGGSLADRLSPRGAVLSYGIAEVFIGLFGLASPSILYRWYPSLSPHLTSTAASFVFHFALLCLPTFLMGSTLPLLSRALVSNTSIAKDIGALYGLNTIGAAAGAFATSGPWLLSLGGLEPLVTLAAALNGVAGIVALALAFIASNVKASVEPSRAAEPLPWRWLTIYAVTGFIALGLELSWFRLLNVVMTSNTYTFSRLLAMYLSGLGLGSVVGTRLLSRVSNAPRTFFWLQLATGLSALVGPALVLGAIEAFGFPTRVAPRNLWAPLVILFIPTVLMGVSFTVMQSVVSRALERVGRSTGSLLFANTVGCVAGSLVTGLWLLDVVGTPATLRLFGVSLAVFGVFAAQRVVTRVAVVAVAVGLAMAVPSSVPFWKALHDSAPANFSVVEDGSCVTALAERTPGQHTLFISGEVQNGVPFDDFHLRLGSVPPLFHSSPKRVLVIGFGAGSTPFGLLADPRVEHVDTVEICGSEYPLVRALEERGFSEVKTLFADQRARFIANDGRKYLVDTTERFDLIVTDTLLQRSSHSGSLYSVEFYELVRSRLAPGGMLAQWAPTPRTLLSAASVFPNVVAVGGPGVNPTESFFLATESPVIFDRDQLVTRLAASRAEGFTEPQRAELRRFIDGAYFHEVPRPPADAELNTDLFPRDEYGRW